ncbi:DUF6776 family protein [Pseudoxanthomonas composti]|uniref:Uncharacterized protein n=1 Tax=Pseudoxanthomonas composti TaxID=2137479 RepID=A0A4Q1JUM4_9GAMM|nr:DUF6776 family protein [Pseudoxanthomonas composti]RXR03533.1 hypothetical protein EPA99_13980 [Pseudoxanthomonas composti]
MPAKTPSRYRIVPATPAASRWRRRLLWGGAWLASLAVVAVIAVSVAGPGAGSSGLQALSSRRALNEAQRQIRTLTQRQATLTRSDSISREANRDLQSTLAERDQEIADLRADVDFYERLVGPTDQRKGLTVFSSQFVDQGPAGWDYQIVLTQTLNRGAISEGQMRLAVEGLRDGKLTTLDWNALHGQAAAPAQTYSFRYFQQLEGRVMLPAGFTPQRVKVSLRGQDVAIERDLDWKVAGT